DRTSQAPEGEIKSKLKWLMLFRILFSTLLLGSTIILQFGDTAAPLNLPIAILYGLIVSIYLLSLVYALALYRLKRLILLTYVQVIIDTFIVTVILFVTGNYSSIFSFLYLVVIIYSSILIPIRGTMVIAAICSIQFGMMIDLEYYGVILPFGTEDLLLASAYTWNQVLYKILITMTACFAVAFLSSFLSEQVRRTRHELRIMADHVIRVDKMAAIGEMAAGLAHEIKNPLASLSGSIQLLREDIRYDADHDRLMQIVLREADRLSSLVTNFLLYARPPAGNVEAMELEKIIIDTIELFEKDANNDGRITTTKNIQPGIWISMDPLHLQQILWNLLINAAEAIDGEGNIHIEQLSTKNKQAHIKIADSGCGMSQDDINLIFDPFFTTKASGTGLGLSIVHRILEGYDALLDVESEINQGTTFTLQFKRLERPA
ncbi:MAG: two-component sensor histidine kinase, partial [Deltaproteobacteria bacterium]|nr:two-component sensor histidine kinase [Deltaproteobacteria bacterium]